MSKKAEYNALQELKKSEGWQYIERVMQDELITVARMLAQNTTMTPQQIDFKRGSMWAADQLLNLPDKLLARLENEITLEEAKKLVDEDDQK